MAAAVLALAAFGLMVTHMQPAPARTLFVRHSSATNAPRQYEPLVGQCIRCNAVTTRHVTPQACTGTEQQTFPAPTAEQSAALSDIKPSPSMTPRQAPLPALLPALSTAQLELLWCSCSAVTLSPFRFLLSEINYGSLPFCLPNARSLKISSTNSASFLVVSFRCVGEACT
eukprot:6184414-Pleurochrysis_carterae.AAC.2